MENNQQVVVQIEFDTKLVDDASRKIASATTALGFLKKQQKELTDTIKEQGYATKEQAAELAKIGKQVEAATRAQKSNTAVVQAATLAQYDSNASLDEQRQYLNTLQKAYASMTKGQMDMLGGQESLAERIKEVSDKVKEQEAAIGDNRRNVGSYAEGVTKAFGEMAHAGELMSPAIGLLRGMGDEGKKAAALLDMLAKTMQLAGKAGKVMQTATAAQTAATQGAAVAQEGLNAAMAANPVGLVIAAVSTLLPLIKAASTAFGDATKETEAFNRELERQNALIEQAQKDAEFEAKVAGLFGASAKQQLDIRRQAAQQAVKDADAYYDKLFETAQNGSKKEQKAARAAMEEAAKQQKEAYDRLNAINQEYTLLEIKTHEEKKQKVLDIQKEQQDELKARAIQAMEEERVLLEMMQRDMSDQMEAAQQMLAELDESEEEEDIPTVAEMVRDRFGLDEEAVEYFRELLEEGYSAQEAATKIVQKNVIATAGAYADAFGSLSGSFDALAQAFNEMEDQSDGTKKAAKAFAWVSLLTSQAQAIANTVTAITQAISNAQQSAAATGPAAVFTAPAFIAEMVAITAGAAASATAGIVQAKQLISQSEQYEHGGIVGGNSYTGDNILARVNSREMILPLENQKTLFDALTGNGDGSLGINYEMMAAAMAAQPAPVLVYSELQEFGDKVTTFNEIAGI